MSLMPYFPAFGGVSNWPAFGGFDSGLMDMENQIARQMRGVDRHINRDFRRLNHLVNRLGGYEMGRAEIKDTADKLEIDLDVNQFKPEELIVRITDNMLTIEADHEERKEEDGSYISRRFTRKYLLPENVDPATVTSTLTNGTLVMQATKKALPQSVARPIPIQTAPQQVAIGK